MDMAPEDIIRSEQERQGPLGALERIERLATPDPDWPVSAESLLAQAGRIACAARAARAEPEEPCHCKTNECGPECPCYEAGLEAQRERVGGGTA